MRIRDLTDLNNWTPEADKEIREMERLLLHRQWYLHNSRDRLSGLRVRMAIQPVFFDWIGRNRKLGISFHLTQLLTGHGCFSDYLYRIEREEFNICFHCGLKVIRHNIP